MAEVTIGGNTYTLGGSTQTNTPTGKPLAPTGVSVYNPKTKTWTVTPIGIQKNVQPGPPPPGQTPFDAGTVSTTEFGTDVNSTAYTAQDVWKVPLEQVPSIKAALVQAGLLSVKNYGNPSVMDSYSAAAYQKVLQFANVYGLTANDALSYYLANPTPQKPTAAGPTIAYTNPQDVETEYQNDSQNLTGQEQDPTQFVQQYHGLEAAQGHGTGQDYTQAPSLRGAAIQYLQKNLAPQELDYGVASRMLEFENMVKSG